MADFTFDTRSRRYRDNRTGRFISIAKLRELSDKQIANRGARARAITDRLLSEEISLREWERQMAREIKTLYLQLYRLAKPDTDARDYGIIGNLLRSQYSRLRAFSQEIAIGELSEARIRDRAYRYLAKAREAFEGGFRENSRRVSRWERRVRTKRESCQPCITFEAMGWQPVGTLPRPTERCDCFDRCGCVLVYSNSRTRPPNSLRESLEPILLSPFGWVR